MSARPVARRALALVLVVLTLSGCSSWRPAPGSPDPALLPAETKQVRVELSSGSRLVLRRPVLVADSLQGVEASDRPQTVVPAAEIMKLETRQADGGKTALLVVGALFAVVVGGIMITAATMDCIMCNAEWSATPPVRVTR